MSPAEPPRASRKGAPVPTKAAPRLLRPWADIHMNHIIRIELHIVTGYALTEDTHDVDGTTDGPAHAP